MSSTAPARIYTADALKPTPTLLNTPPPTPGECMAEWESIGQSKREDRERILARYPKWRVPIPPHATDVSALPLSKLSPRETIIVQTDATGLVDKLARGEYTSVEVTTAFCKAATVAQDATNCLTEIFFDQALARAAELDRHLKETGKVVGPLHGLPVSVKDHILIRGLDTSTGYVAWAYKTVADRDAVVVDILRKAGAVLYVKTANPQTLLCLETNNNVYGRTLNPFNRKLSPGGSSGGEGALVASFGSPMGVGTDIGGSIRVPASWSGVYGFKASVARMPHAGLLGSHDGMDNIVGVVGPIARSARDLALFSRVMLTYEAWLLEHAVLEIPWRDDVARGVGLPKKLSFAILSDDGVVKPHPPIRHALKRTKEALLAAGHEVIEWEPMDHQEAWDLIVKLYLLDGGEEYRATLAETGEPAVPGTEWMLSFAAGRKPYTVAETFKLNLEREAFRSRALRHWNATIARTTTGRPVDGIICPIAPTLAPPHDTVRWWGYSSYWNLLDYPGAVFPMGRFSASDFVASEADDASGLLRNEAERYVAAQWDARTYDNAPIGLQLVGRRHNEEKVLAMLEVVEGALNGGK